MPACSPSTLCLPLHVAADARSHSNYRALWSVIAASCQGSETSCKLLCAAMRKPKNKDTLILNECRRTGYSPSRSWPCRVSCMLCKAVSQSWSQTLWDVCASNIQSMGRVTASVVRVPKAIRSSPPASHLLSMFLLSSLYNCGFSFLFLSLRRGSRLEVEDLMRVADKVTTILSNASSDRIHVRTLIGIA